MPRIGAIEQDKDTFVVTKISHDDFQWIMNVLDSAAKDTVKLPGCRDMGNAIRRVHTMMSNRSKIGRRRYRG